MKNINRKLYFNLILIFNGYVITTESYDHEIFSNDDTHLSRIMYNELIREIEYQQRLLRSVTDMSATSTAESSSAETITEGSGETTGKNMSFICITFITYFCLATEVTNVNTWIGTSVNSDQTPGECHSYLKTSQNLFEDDNFWRAYTSEHIYNE